MFYNLLEQNMISSLSFEEQIKEKVDEIWNQHVRAILKDIYTNNNLSVADKEIEVKKRFDTSPYLLQMLTAIKQANSRNFYASLGFLFENIGIEQILNPVFDKMSARTNAISNGLITAFSTGARQSLAASVSGIRNIRPDTIISLNQIEFINDQGVLKESKSELPVEMQGQLNIEWGNMIPSAEEIMTQKNLLEMFLNGGNFFGLSFKTWDNNTNGKAFTSSTPLASAFNNLFNQKDSKGKKHAWQYNYTSEYVAYILSKNIFQIIGPTNIGMFTANGIIWMDEFLASHLFFMRIQIQRRFKGEWFFPQITDPEIYVRNYNLQKTIKSLTAKRHFTKQNGNYIDLQLNFL